MIRNSRQLKAKIQQLAIMKSAWDRFVKQSYFVGNLSWEKVAYECLLLSGKVLSSLCDQ